MPTQRNVFNVTVHVFERILLLPAVDLNFQPLVVIEKKNTKWILVHIHLDLAFISWLI